MAQPDNGITTTFIILMSDSCGYSVLEEGRKEGIIIVAVRMKQQGVRSDMISNFTGLDIETVNNH